MNESAPGFFIRVNLCSSVVKNFGDLLAPPASGQETGAAIPSTSCALQESRRTRRDQFLELAPACLSWAAIRGRRCCFSVDVTHPNHHETPRRGQSFHPFV